ncbi:MAG: DISARM system phospholipase D-like protein DrmC [Myxococcota bacterium]
MSGLDSLTARELAFLANAIHNRELPVPVTQSALAAMGGEHLYARLGALCYATQATAAIELVEEAMRQRGTATASATTPDPATVTENTCAPSRIATTSTSAREVAAAEHTTEKLATTVAWTGPSTRGSKSRKTSEVLLEVLANARREVLVVGYEFDHGATLFEPLHRAMKERGVEARFVIDVGSLPSRSSNAGAYLSERVRRFLELNWPFGPPWPELYCAECALRHRSYRSVHAKCVVVDRRYCLVGSANFTKRGHTRNLEIGVLLDDRGVADTLFDDFEGLLVTRELRRLPVVSATTGLPESEPEEGEALATARELDEQRADRTLRDKKADALADELLVSADARSLFVDALRLGAPVPAVGEDIEDARGRVVASPEFAWFEAPVAVLPPEQARCSRALRSGGWRCFVLPLSGSERISLLDILAETYSR